MSYPPTFKDMQDSVIANLRLEDALDRSKAKDWLNTSYMEACIEVEYWLFFSTSTQLAANATTVTVPAAMLIIDYVVSQQADGTNYGPMQQVGLDEILQNRAWASAASPTQGAPQMYSYQSSNQPTIEIWPVASGGEVLTFYGSKLPTPMSADGDVLVLPEPYGSNIVTTGAMNLAAEFKQNLIMMTTYQQENQYWTQRLRALQNNRPGNTAQQFKVLNARRPVSATNSVDIPANW